MMKKCLVVFLMLMTICMCGFAEDEMDTSEQQKKVQELGIPTVTSVGELKNLADNLWNGGDYEGAAQVYSKYSEQANWLANIISANLEPYYSADYDTKKYWNLYGGIDLDSLTPLETTANEYKSERNRAMVYEGLCYYNMKDYGKALPLLLKALDILEADQGALWKTAIKTVCTMVGVTVPF